MPKDIKTYALDQKTLEEILVWIIYWKQSVNPDHYYNQDSEVQQKKEALNQVYEEIKTLRVSVLADVPEERRPNSNIHMVLFIEYCILKSEKLLKSLLQYRINELPAKHMAVILECYTSFLRKNEHLLDILFSFIDLGAYGRLSAKFWLAIDINHPIIEERVQAFLDFASQEAQSPSMHKLIQQRRSMLKAFLDKYVDSGWSLFDNIVCAQNQNIAVLFLKYFINNRIISYGSAHYQEFIQAIWLKAHAVLNIKVIVFLKSLHSNLPLNRVTNGQTLLFRVVLHDRIFVQTLHSQYNRSRTKEECLQQLSDLVSLGARFAPVEYLIEDKNSKECRQLGAMLYHKKLEDKKEQVKTLYSTLQFMHTIPRCYGLSTTEDNRDTVIEPPPALPALPVIEIVEGSNPVIFSQDNPCSLLDNSGERFSSPQPLCYTQAKLKQSP